MADSPTLEEHLAMHQAADDANAAPAYPAKDKWKHKQIETPMELTLESILNFGKHKGKQVEDLIDDAPDYLRWLCEKKIRPFDEEALTRFADEGII